MPRVSIGVPVFNGERYLRDALDSLKAQTFRDFEVLISDNASTDRTEEVAREYCRSDERFRYFRHTANQGAATNFNFVFHQSEGPLFKWHAHDDLIAPRYLEACVSAFDAADDSVVLVYPQTQRIDASGTELGVYDRATRRPIGGPADRLFAMIGPGDHTESILHLCFPIFGLIRRRVLVDTSLIANMPRSDHLLLVELALLGAFEELEEPLFLRREHPGGSVTAAETAAKSGPELERALAAWFDPSRGSRFPATVSRLGLGYLAATLRTPLSVRDRISCTRTALGWQGRHARIIGGELKIVLSEQVSRRPRV